jgi:TolB-like protein
MADVFVSYKAEDRRRVKPLVETLQAEGFSVWWDEQIGGGAAWRQAIEAELNAAKCVIVIWSNRSAGPEGTFVQDEATRAQQRHVYVPVLIDKVHLPLGFGETQALALNGWRGDRADARYQAVLAAVGRHVGRKRRPNSVPIAVSSIDRRTLIGGSAVAAVAVAGLGAWALFKPSPASGSVSIAVLPFENLSGNPAQAYFADGIAEEIRSALARLGGLTVIGRTSSEAVRNDDAPTAAKKLGVANILTGSVRQSPSTIRISAELVDGRTGADRWSQDYDRSPGDAIKIQSDIAENVATALSAALGGAVRKAITVGRTGNASAQRLYLQAKAMADSSTTQSGLQRALELLDSALAVDPNYADAYALKSSTLVAYGNSYSYGARELAQSRADALRLAQKALSIAPNLPAAHRALFDVYSSNLQMTPAYAEISRAVELAPGDADTLTFAARFTGTVLDKMDEAFALSDRAIAADPLNPSPYTHRLLLLFFARRYQDAVDYGKRLGSNSAQIPRFIWIGSALLMLGRLQEAQQYFSQAPDDFWGRIAGEALLRARSGNRAGAEATLAKLENLFGDAASAQIAEINAQVGDKDKAFAALERGYAVKDGGLIPIRVDPFLDPLRSDPRFGALLQKMNFPSA